MSYTVLARRYRSSTFDDVVGQNHVAQTLKKAIQCGRIAHAYLFCGTRGVGKTSMARILAKALNCHASDGPTVQPCLKCVSCQAIARGEDMDVIEIDAASNTQVDKTREVILENAQYSPASSRFKIFIIDEVHMLSKQSFNALLKTLEEPPSHVKFILATTEPEKVLPTILSRCQRYDFRNISAREIAAHLRNICRDEKIEADEQALLLVAKAGAGSMRDAISLLERLLSIGETKLTVATIEQLLGLPKAQLIFDLVAAIGEGRVKDVLVGANRIICEGLSPDGLIGAIVDHLRNLLIIRTCGKESDLVEAPSLSLEDLAAQAARFDPQILSQDITLLEDLRRQLRQSQVGRALLDAALVRLALAEQFTPIEELLFRVQAQRPAAAQKKKPEPLSTSADAPPPATAAVSSTRQAPVSVELADDDDDDLPRPGKVWAGTAVSPVIRQVPTAPAPLPAAAEPSNIEPVDPSNLGEVWKRVLAAFKDRPSVHSLLAMGELIEVSGEEAKIRYHSINQTLPKMLSRNGKRELLCDVLTRVLGRNVGVKFTLDEQEAPAAESTSGRPSGAAPTAHAEAPAAARTRAAAPEPASCAQPGAAPGVYRPSPQEIQELARDELVGALLSELDGTIVRVSEEPLPL